MIEETWKSVQQSWLQRVASPLAGSLTVSWLIWNHRTIIALFSGNASVSARFEYIDSNIYPTIATFLGMNVIGPTLSAVAYIFLFPWPARAVYKFTLRRRRELVNLSKAVEGQEIVTRDDIAELVRRADEADSKRAEMSALIDAEKERMNTIRGELALENLELKGRCAYAEGFGAFVDPNLTQKKITAYVTGTQFRMTGPGIGLDGVAFRLINFLPNGSLGGQAENHFRHWKVESDGRVVFSASKDGEPTAECTLELASMQLIGLQLGSPDKNAPITLAPVARR